MGLKQEFPQIKGVMLPGRDKGSQRLFNGNQIIARLIFEGNPRASKVPSSREVAIAFRFLAKAAPFLTVMFNEVTKVASESWTDFHSNRSFKYFCSMTIDRSSEQVEVVVYDHGMLSNCQLYHALDELKAMTDTYAMSIPWEDREIFSHEMPVEKRTRNDLISIPNGECVETVEEEIIDIDWGSLTVSDLVMVVSEHYSLRREDVLSKSRERKFVRVRHLIMYIAYNYLGLSYKSIGEELMNFDRSTVMYGIAVIQGLLEHGLEGVSESLKAIFQRLEQ